MMILGNSKPSTEIDLWYLYHALGSIHYGRSHGVLSCQFIDTLIKYNSILYKHVNTIYSIHKGMVFVVMHQSFVTRTPLPRVRVGMAMEMSGALTKVLPWQCGGNTGGLLYIGKKDRKMKR